MPDYLSTVSGGDLRVFKLLDGANAEQVAQVRVGAMPHDDVVKFTLYILAGLRGADAHEQEAKYHKPRKRKPAPSIPTGARAAKGFTHVDALRVVREAGANGATTSDIAAALGLSNRVAVSLMSWPKRQGMVRTEPQAGKVGRPMNRYFAVDIRSEGGVLTQEAG